LTISLVLILTVSVPVDTAIIMPVLAIIIYILNDDALSCRDLIVTGLPAMHFNTPYSIPSIKQMLLIIVATH